MDSKSRRNLILRGILFLVFVAIYIVDESEVINIVNYDLFLGIKLYHICWMYLVIDLLKVMIPRASKNTYNGKLFLKHYLERENYNREKLERWKDESNKSAVNILIFWVILNALIFYIYFKLGLKESFLIILFLFYYFSDMICVNIWCPFHVIFMKNKCCNVCRIYNWDHMMFFTPFILMPGFFTYSLVILALISAIQWEYLFSRHPERFSSISNLNLSCSNCNNDCRFNKLKVENRKMALKIKHQKNKRQDYKL